MACGYHAEGAKSVENGLNTVFFDYDCLVGTRQVMAGTDNFT